MAATDKTYKVIVNGFEFLFSQKELDTIDLVKISPTEFNIIRDHHSFNTKLLGPHSAGKKIRMETEGQVFEVEIRDELDQTLEKMGLNASVSKQVKEIKAPMPGLVLEIAVKEGQELKEGEKILILEAMKMENSIMIHSAARIKKIAVKPGQAVEKGQVLVELE